MKNIIGSRFGKLTELESGIRNSRKDYAKSLFICDCGNTIFISRNVVLKYNSVDSCLGCKNKKADKEKLINNTK